MIRREDIGYFLYRIPQLTKEKIAPNSEYQDY
jgi:hypothetical protein